MFTPKFPHTRYILAGFFAFLFVASLLSCGSSSTRFRLEAQFKNINQGEFYIYNTENGKKDTVAVLDGHFVYERSLQDSVTYVLIFPNYSEMAFFAAPGAKVTMKGDVTHLRETEVTGTEDNELMTAFRLKTADMTPPDVQAEAEKFINDHPASLVSAWLLRRHFIQSVSPDYPLAFRLSTLLREAQPANQELARLALQLEGLQHFNAEGQLPDFKVADAKGDTITNKYLDADVNVIVAWSSWNFESQVPLHTLSDLLRPYKKRLKVLTVSVDASSYEGKDLLERDSIQWPNVCDGLLFESPFLQSLGIATVPANIIADRTGKILARNVKSSEFRNKIETLLPDE